MSTDDGRAGGPLLRGERVLLRPVTAEDAAPLLAILGDPEVARWWRRDEWARIVEQAAWTFAITVEGEVVGCIQYGEEPDPDYRFANVDLFLSARHHGCGLGSDAMRTLIRYLIEERGLRRFVVDPAAANERAIRVYERLGFRRVGVMRDYERAADGSWHDGLLMELLAAEFDRGSSPQEAR